MTGNVKRLIGGLVIGLLVIFALVGIKSMLSEDEKPPELNTWQQPSTSGIVGLPGANGVPSSSQQDTAIAPDNTKVELINEPEPPAADVTPTPRPVSKPAPVVAPPAVVAPVVEKIVGGGSLELAQPARGMFASAAGRQ